MAASRYCTTLLAVAAYLLAGKLVQLAKGQADFRPLTEDVTFKAVYRLRAFVGSQADFMSEIQEFYQHNLQLASIYRTNYWKFTWSSRLEQVTRHFYYSAELARELELVELDNGLAETETVQLHPDGAEPAAGPAHSRATAASLLSGNTSILASFFYLRSVPAADNLIRLEEFFLDSRCREKTSSKLSYVRGVSSVLHLIECNRASIKYLLSSDGRTPDNPQGGRARVFRAEDLASNSSTRRLDISVELADQSFQGRDSHLGDPLPSRVAPLAVVLTFKPERITFRLDLFQLEMIEASQLLASTLAGHLLLPAAIGLPDKLYQAAADGRPPDKQVHRVDQFSFRARLSGGLLKRLGEPVELEVAYDGQSRLLGRRESRVAGAGGVKRSSRLLYDGQAKLKYSLVADNLDYQYPIEEQEAPAELRHRWRTCATSFLTSVERHELESGDVGLFELKGALFLGMSQVRGVPCYVYERRLLRLPFWLGAGETHAQGQLLYATIYESATELDMGSFMQEARERERADRASRLVRVEINQVPEKETKMKGQGSSNLFTLDLHAFSWSLQMADWRRLFDISQDCLLLQPTLHHLDLKLELAPEPDKEYEAEQVKAAEGRLVEDVSRLLAKTLELSRTQLVDLEAKFAAQLGGRLQVSLSVYELPKQVLVTSLVGRARDLAVGQAAQGSWSVGATSLTLEECEWRAAHTLVNHQVVRFMHCPARMHCVLGDQRWDKLENSTETTIQGVLRYPVAADYDSSNRCDVYLMSEVAGKPAGDTDRDSQLHWLLSRQTHLLGRRLELRYDEDASLGLELIDVHMSNPLDGRPRLSSVRGLGYTLQSEQVRPLVVSDLGQCADTCRSLHACASYSACHLDNHQLECLLTRVNWTEPAKIEQLRSLARPAVELGAGSARSPSVAVRLEGEEQEQKVQLQRTQVCTIYTRQHLDVFVLQRNHRGPKYQTDSKALNLAAESADECGRLCTERARVLGDLLSLRSPKELGRGYTCVSFRFQRSSSLCELLPSLKADPFRNISDWSAAGGAGARWQRAISAGQVLDLEDQSARELYILDYERLFAGQPGQRLAAAGDRSDRWQQMLAEKMSAKNCARLCLGSRQCRSFDLLSSTSAGLLGICVLNQLALVDIGLQVDGAPLQVTDECGLSRCWHYEPSELALFIMWDGGQLAGDWRPLAAPAAHEARGIFVEYQPLVGEQVQPASSAAMTSAKSERVQVSWLLVGLLLVLAAALLLLASRHLWPAPDRAALAHPTTAPGRQPDVNGRSSSAVSSAWRRVSAGGRRAPSEHQLAELQLH